MLRFANVLWSICRISFMFDLFYFLFVIFTFPPFLRPYLALHPLLLSDFSPATTLQFILPTPISALPSITLPLSALINLLFMVPAKLLIAHSHRILEVFICNFLYLFTYLSAEICAPYVSENVCMIHLIFFLFSS